MSNLFPDNVIHTVSDKTAGNLSFLHSEASEVIANRERFLKSNKIELSDCVVLQLQHEETILAVTEANRGAGTLEGDSALVGESLMTDSPGVFLFLLTGDCFPVSYYDQKKQVVALAHLGRKPTHRKLAGKTVEAMMKHYNCSPSDIVVHIGPGIHKESYLFTQEEVQPFLADYPEWLTYTKTLPNGMISIDLLSYIIDQLTASGILKQNIEIDPRDTVTDSNLFSHYRSVRTGEPQGRFATVIGMTN